MLKSFKEPFSGIRFCPTGGITADNLLTFLRLPNVACVGGTWIAPSSLVRARAWDQIAQRARRSLRTGRQPGSRRGMSWRRPAPFVLDIEVGAEHLDEFAHVNNVVYVGWLEQCAWAHSRALGLGLDEFLRLDRGMLVVRHEIDYLAAAREGERLELGTWIVECDRPAEPQSGVPAAPPGRRRHPAARTDPLRLRRAVQRQAARRLPAEFVERYGRALVNA